MTICCYAATYVVYTYVTPILTDVLGVGETLISPLLMAVGVCCMCSNLLAGWLGSRGDVKRTPVVLVLQTALFLAMPLLLGSRWTGLPAVFAMCLLMYLLSTPVQYHASTLAETEHPYAVILCASTLSVAGNIGIALGSFASSGLQEALGLRTLGFPAAGFALAWHIGRYATGRFAACLLLPVCIYALLLTLFSFAAPALPVFTA